MEVADLAQELRRYLIDKADVSPAALGRFSDDDVIFAYISYPLQGGSKWFSEGEVADLVERCETVEELMAAIDVWLVVTNPVKGVTRNEIPGQFRYDALSPGRAKHSSLEHHL